MFETDSEIYQFIVDDLNNIADKNWVMITLDVRRNGEGHIGLGGEYINNIGETKQLLDVWKENNNLSKGLHSLYQIMTVETDKHKWNRLKATLIKDEDLNIKFDWDQELADELEEAGKKYDPRWDDSLTQEEKNKKYAEMVRNGELPDLSDVNIKIL